MQPTEQMLEVRGTRVRVLRGGDNGPLGETFRLVREMGGFLRFAPLPSGGLETRLFLPAA